jgi:hypothetical protein
MEYTRGARGRREVRKKICKANNPRGKPAHSPSVKSKKKKMEELLSRP